MQLDLSYSNSVPIMLPHHNHIEFIVVGTGGTGGFLIAAIARLLIEITTTTSKTASCLLIDGDKVEAKNVPRQNFQPSEIGLYKSQVLALRYSLAFGCKISAINQPFQKQMVGQLSYSRQLTIIIGCVDNAAARSEISACLDCNYSGYPPDTWWLDCGNHESSGQVMLGSTNRLNQKIAFDNFKQPNFCVNLPSPTLVHPELLEPPVLNSIPLSCAEIEARNRQSLFVNQQVAAIASDYLLALTLTGGLRRFATYFNSGSGSARSLYTDLKTIQQYINR